jgi:hypothetical protein
MRVNFIQMLLQQRLLGQNGIFDDQLEQAGDVMGIQMMAFAESSDAPADRVRGRYHAPDGGSQFGFTHLNSQSAALCQQRKQFLIQGADLIAQSQ